MAAQSNLAGHAQRLAGIDDIERAVSFVAYVNTHKRWLRRSNLSHNLVGGRWMVWTLSPALLVWMMRTFPRTGDALFKVSPLTQDASVCHSDASFDVQCLPHCMMIVRRRRSRPAGAAATGLRVARNNPRD